MSMLAEPRRRKRYLLNPRGKALYEDDSRFGTKMLEKMGWSKGKGLGANESGSLDFVRVQLKNNSEGLGYAETNRDDQWTAHEENFNGLLKNLNGEVEAVDGQATHNNNSADNASEDELRPIGFGFITDQVKTGKKKSKLKEKISGISLEEKSKSSKARVHYKKFTRGKDLSQYSEKDLANIFGKKAVDDQVDDIYQQLNKSMGLEKLEEKSEDKNEVKSNFGGVPTVSTGLSVADYFKQKMEAIKNKNKNMNQIEMSEEQPLVNGEVPIEEEQSVKKPKKKSKSNGENIDLEEDQSLVNNQTENAVQKELSIKKSKKKKKTVLNGQSLQPTSVEDEKEPLANGDGELAPGGELPAKKSKKKNQILNDQIVERKGEKKPKKRLKEDMLSVSVANEEPTEETEPKRKKKKKNNKNDDDKEEMEPFIERNNEDIEESSIVKKKKNKKAKTEEIKPESEKKEEPTDVETTQLKIEQAEISLKKKKKSKKNKDMESSPSEENSLPPQSSIEVTSTKTKKKKNKNLVEEIPDVSDILANEEPIDKSSNEDSDTQEEKELLSMEQLLEKRDSFNIYTISTFTAEKFRNCNLNAFRGSTLSKIPGYSCTDNINLKVIQSRGDEKRILQLWSNQVTKYGESSNQSFNKRHVQPLRKSAKRKTIRTHLNAIKRRSAFTII